MSYVVRLLWWDVPGRVTSPWDSLERVNVRLAVDTLLIFAMGLELVLCAWGMRSDEGGTH